MLVVDDFWLPIRCSFALLFSRLCSTSGYGWERAKVNKKNPLGCRRDRTDESARCLCTVFPRVKKIFEAEKALAVDFVLICESAISLNGSQMGKRCFCSRDCRKRVKCVNWGMMSSSTECVPLKTLVCQREFWVSWMNELCHCHRGIQVMIDNWLSLSTRRGSVIAQFFLSFAHFYRIMKVALLSLIKELRHLKRMQIFAGETKKIELIRRVKPCKKRNARYLPLNHVRSLRLDCSRAFLVLVTSSRCLQTHVVITPETFRRAALNAFLWVSAARLLIKRRRAYCEVDLMARKPTNVN